MADNRVTLGNVDVDIHALMLALTMAKDAKVGYPEETTGSVIHSEAEVPIATLAAWQELGTENMPPRAFMRQGAEIMVQRRGLMSVHVRRLAAGKMHADRFMIAMGNLLKSSITAAISRGDFPPLAPETVAAKGHAQILVDSGEMRDALDVHLDRL